MSLGLDKLNERQRQAVLHAGRTAFDPGGRGERQNEHDGVSNRPSHSGATRSGRIDLGIVLYQQSRDRAQGAREEFGCRGQRGDDHDLSQSLRPDASRPGQALGFQPNFAIVDRSDQKDILKKVMNIRIDDRKFDLDVLLFEFGRVKNRLLGPQEAEAYFTSTKSLGSEYAVAAASLFRGIKESSKH